MLQQTQVDTVLPYYERFLKRFPTVRHLAESCEEEVLSGWSGLGYYSRARNLRLAAQVLVEKYKGRVPKEKKALLSLPGIGPYTAGAIASIAFQKKEPVLDGNVTRVLARLFGVRQNVCLRVTQRKLWEKARFFANHPKPGDINQALMELGAVICLPQNPSCLLCPLQKQCIALHKGWTGKIPVTSKSGPSVKVHYAAAIIRKGGRWLLAKRPDDRHLGGLWEFPQAEVGKIFSYPDVTKVFRKKLGVELSIQKALPKVQHAIMNRQMTIVPLLCRLQKGKLQKIYYQNYRWKTVSTLGSLPASSLNQKILRLSSTS